MDVLLVKDSQSIAVEVSSTTSAGHELENIRKCLRAGYDVIAAVSPHARKTNALRKLAAIELSAAELRTIQFWSPDDLLAHLADSPTDESVVKGYRVTVQRSGLEETELKARMEAIREALDSDR